MPQNYWRVENRGRVNNSFHSGGKSTEEFLRDLRWDHLIQHFHKC